MKTRLRTKLSLRISVIILITSAGAGWYTYSRSVREYEDITARIINNTSSLVDERMDALLNSAQSSSRLLAALVKPTTGGDDTDRLPVTTLERTKPALIDMMSLYDLFGSVSITADRTGSTLRVLRMNDGSLVIQNRANGSVLEQRPFGSGYADRPRYRDDFDPRETEYYKLCKASREPVWTTKTEIRPSPGVQQPATTIACPIIAQNGEFVGVSTVDITLEDLSRFLQTIRVSDRGVAFLVDVEAAPKVIAYPDASRFLVSSGGVQSLVGPENLGMPALPTFLGRFRPSRNVMAGQIVRETFDRSGEQWQGSWMLMEGAGRPKWATCVLIPSSDFTAGVRETAAFVLIGTAIALGLGIVMTLFVAQRISRPLGQLVRETRRIQEMDFAERPLPATDVIEIGELSGSIEQVKRGLRSFERLVPSEYARYLIKSGQEARLGGTKQRLTTSFSDLVGFTALSESISPEELGRILEEYLNVLSGEVVKTHGTIDKYNGDDVMAFWGAPVPMTNHALAACQSALGMRATLDRLYPEWAERGIPRLRVSCGIVTGEVIVGNVGSRDRMNYTVIGDSVNLASRLQGLNRLYGTELLIGETTQAEVQGDILTRLVDWVIPAGKEHSVAVYELIGPRTEASGAQFELVKDFEKAMESYRLRRWDEAIAGFMAILEKYPHDGPSLTLTERCRRFKDAPPGPDWVGAHRVGFK
jgi:adenylate cyclase